MKRTPADSAASSLAFRQPVGATLPAALLAAEDYGFDFDRYSSEGVWAFCRFEGSEISAARIGFQHGAFDLGRAPQLPDRSYLQLHLEIMSADGALLWLPSGHYRSEQVVSEPGAMRASLQSAGQEIFRYRGWPGVDCQFRSEDESLQALLHFELGAVTVLPDGVLPQCVFAMWESMGRVSGSIRYLDRTLPVHGKVFFDHTRIIRRRSDAPTRGMSLYTTMYFEDGSGVFGYWTVDQRGAPIEQYCFGVYLDAAGGGRFLADAALSELVIDRDGIASSWRLHFQDLDHELSLALQIVAQQHPIRRCWGAPGAPVPVSRAEFSIIPLVLDGSAQLRRAAQAPKPLRGWGLAEYYDARLWPFDPKRAPAAG
jgi:hypothetical protein